MKTNELSARFDERPLQAGKPPARRSVGILAAVLVLTGAGGVLVMRSDAKVNKVALSASPKPVTVVSAKATTFRKTHSYVGTLHPWVEANVGPQLVSAYVDTVLVRPGAKVHRGDILATLDCRNTNAGSSAVAMQAHAIEARQKAVADEASRTKSLLEKGFASPNETEQIQAQSASEMAQLEAQKATLAKSTLEVGDCVLHAPFDGEIGDRFVDPGAFARPGTAIVSVVDRSTVRFAADVPEVDFAVVAPDTKVKIHADAVELDIDGVIVRRAPHADTEARTVHFEVDIPNKDRSIPVDTTAEVTIAYGDSLAVSEIPLYAATIRSGKATMYSVDGAVAHAHTVPVIGESGGLLYIDQSITPGSAIVTEGRSLLIDGDNVVAKAAP